MKPASFEYVAVTDVDEAVQVLADWDGEASVLAGGQSLVPLMNLRLARPAALVDVNGIGGLDGMDLDNGTVRLGALCRHRRLELDAHVRERVPLLSQAAALVGHPQVRNRGTLGGSLSHADPSSELGAAVVALGGSVTVAGPGGSRRIAADELFAAPFTTTLEIGELVTEVTVPAAQPGQGTAFVEFAPRHGDFAVAGVGVVVTLDGGRCSAVRAGACGVGSTVVDLSEALQRVVGEGALTDALLQAVASDVAGAAEPPSDVHASGEDRAELLQLLAVQALRRAWASASGQEAG